MNIAVCVAVFGASFAAGLSGALMPGPVLTATVAQTLRRGRWAGSLIVLGHAFPELAILALLLAGGGTWLRHPVFLGVVGLVGGVCLLAMGIDILRHRAQAIRTTERTLAEGAVPASAPRHPVVDGVVLSLTNPYWTLWWATLGLGLAGQALDSLGLAGLAVFFVGHLAADFSWYTGVSVAVAAGRRVLPPVFFQRLFAVCGAAMLLLAAKFLRDGVLHFR